MNGSQEAVAIDAKLPYAEIGLGSLSNSNHTWMAPYQSDWAIAVGDFAAGRTVKTHDSIPDKSP